MTTDDKPTEKRLSVAPADAGERPSLLIVSKAGVFAFALPDQGEVTLGRSSECTVNVDDVKASRVHAILRITMATHEGGPPVFSLVDLGSMNGTLVGDRRISPEAPVPLAIGDRFTIGSTVIVLQRAPQPSAPGIIDVTTPASERDRLDRIARAGGWDSATMRKPKTKKKKAKDPSGAP